LEAAGGGREAAGDRCRRAQRAALRRGQQGDHGTATDGARTGNGWREGAGAEKLEEGRAPALDLQEADARAPQEDGAARLFATGGAAAASAEPVGYGNTVATVGY
jgi:hypothetical protein